MMLTCHAFLSLRWSRCARKGSRFCQKADAICFLICHYMPEFSRAGWWNDRWEYDRLTHGDCTCEFSIDYAQRKHMCTAKITFISGWNTHFFLLWRLQVLLEEDAHYQKHPCVHTGCTLTFINTCVISQVLSHTLHSVCSHTKIHPSLAMSVIVWMELDGFQTLLQQCLILCSTLPYSGGRDHGDQRPKACKHEWDQSPWMTSTVRMEIKHPSFRFVRLSGPFYSPNPRHLELCLPHLKLHPAADHTRRAHLMVTAGMSGFSAWFVP